MHGYVKIRDMSGAVDPDAVLRDDGVELRRANTPEWAEYEAFLAGGGAPQDTLSPVQWARLNGDGKRRALARRPPGAARP